MKKTISLTLALVLALSLAACGKNGNTDSSADVPADANTLLTTVWDSYTDDEKFPAAGGDYENPVEDAPGAVDISDADNLNYMLTLPVEDASKIDGAAALSHMMNANTFTCGAFHITSKDRRCEIHIGSTLCCFPVFRFSIPSCPVCWFSTFWRPGS